VRIAVAAPAAIAAEPTITPRAQQRFTVAARTVPPGAADDTWGAYDRVPLRVAE
jgi:hypothetical protein